MRQSNEARITDDRGFFVSEVYHTHSNSPGQVRMYPALCYPKSGNVFSRFQFSNSRQIELYPCPAHPLGMGVVK